MQWRNGNIAFIHCRKIGARPGVALIARRAYPVQGIAARILLRDHLIGRMAVAAAGHADAFDLVKGQVRDIDVEDPPGAQRFTAESAQESTGHRRGGVVVLIAIERHGQRGEPQMAAFHRRRHGAGVNDVIAQVGSGVDAGNDDVRTRAHQRVHAKVDAVRRRPHLDGDIAIFKGKGAQ